MVKKISLFQESKENRGDNKQECDNMIPLQCFCVENRDCNCRKDRQGNSFLNDFQLHQAEWTAVDAAANAVGRNHKAVFKEGEPPGSEDDENQRPVGADVHFFKFEVAVPSKSHENVGAAEKEDCKNTGFHILVISG